MVNFAINKIMLSQMICSRTAVFGSSRTSCSKVRVRQKINPPFFCFFNFFSNVRVVVFPAAPERSGCIQSAPQPFVVKVSKDGGATNAAGGGNSCGTESSAGQFHQPGESRRVLRKQLCPGTCSYLILCVEVKSGNMSG